MTVFLFMRLYVKKLKIKLHHHQHLSGCWIFYGGVNTYLSITSPSHTFLSLHFLFYIKLSPSASLLLPPSPISLPWPILSFLISAFIWSLSLLPLSLYVGRFNKVELHSRHSCHIWSTFQLVFQEAQCSVLLALQGPASALIQECLSLKIIWTCAWSRTNQNLQPEPGRDLPGGLSLFPLALKWTQLFIS